MLPTQDNRLVQLIVADMYNDGKCLITTKSIRPKDPIWILVGEVEKRTKYTIEQDGKHYIDELIMFMNHSCDPNCYIENRVIHAKKEIQAFEQLTFDYNKTENQISSSFNCRCGSSNCRGRIG